jgi:hypothetical protein
MSGSSEDESTTNYNKLINIIVKEPIMDNILF